MKFNITPNIPELSDQEISEKQNFDLLIKGRTQYIKRKNKQFKIKLFVSSIILLAAITTAIIVLSNEQNNQSIIRYKAPVGQLESDIVIKEIASETNRDKKDTQSSKNTSTNEANKTAIISKEQLPTDKEAPTIDKTQKPIANYQYVQAYPLVGMDSLQAYLNENIRYPQKAINDSLMIEGTITVLFTIDISGIPVDIQIKNSLGELFDEEAKRLVQNMPVWSPATINGRPTEAHLSIPLIFNSENQTINK